jgi:alpha-ketoglutarate-dependent taurine dioxygenase
MLQGTIRDKNFVWDKSISSNLGDFLVKISNNAINELKIRHNFLNNSEDSFPILQKEITDFKKKFLIEGIGLFVIDGKCFTDFSKEESIEIYKKICKILGTLYIQNNKNEKFVKIYDVGKSMQTGGRYHQTKEGGSFHTDSPQWKKVPDFIGLCCVNPAKKGGQSKFVNVYSIHNEMLKDHKHFLEMLYQQYHFDKRGEYEPGESPTVLEPIFTYDDNHLKCRYLRNYINDGHKIQNVPLSKEQNEALDIFDKIIHDENLAISYDLKQKDMVFFNNNRILHGRTYFEDFEDIEKKRLMLRTWIKDKSDN